MGVSENTIVIFMTDDVAMADWYPDGGATPIRDEKATTWEGDLRVPMLECRLNFLPAKKKKAFPHWQSNFCHSFSTINKYQHVILH